MRPRSNGSIAFANDRRCRLGKPESYILSAGTLANGLSEPDRAEIPSDKRDLVPDIFDRANPRTFGQMAPGCSSRPPPSAGATGMLRGQRPRIQAPSIWTFPWLKTNDPWGLIH